MEEANNDKMMQLICSFSNFKDEMIKSMNHIREDMNYIRGDIKDLKDDLKEFKEETNRRWEENNRRWDENDKRWDANDKKWEKYEIYRKEDRKYILDILTTYEVSISEQLGDPNVRKMRKLN